MSALLQLASELETTTDEQFMTWVKTGTGFPYPKYGPIFHAWERAIGAIGLGGPSEYYDLLLQGLAPKLSLEAIQTADLRALLGYATYIVRGERFCDGHIGACQSNGYLAAIVRRLAQLDNA